MDIDTEKRVDRLLERYAKYGRASELSRIRDAYEFAAEAHKDQFRQSGEPYISHPLAVAEIVIDMELDADSIIAALLHDVVEDTPVTLDGVRARYGDDVADIVDGLTKLARIPYTSKAEQEMENLRKMFMAMAKDIRVILIKLADRLHNVRTLDAKPENRRREIALETMDIYSPIAHRLGMTKIKSELEDISLKYLDPIGYDEITSALENTAEAREEMIASIKKRLSERLAAENMPNAYIEGRVKHIYSIYRKVYGQNKTIDEVYDLYAVRVIVDTKEDCYNVLGVVHDMYKPIPGRFKDYISTPKPNMYQSLHTTVIGKLGVPFEVQIRTWEMHHIAEYGVAAHWKYKDGVTESDFDYEKKLGWVRQMLESQQDVDAEDFLSNFKIDMFADEVYVFTPKGDVISLPAGATTVDFAYMIHSEVGNRMTGAKVNSRIVTLDTELHNGDIVEIMTAKNSRGPGRDWLRLAKTAGARSKIKQWFKRERRDENIEQGRLMLEHELRRFNLTFSTLSPDAELSAAKKLSFTSFDDLCAGVGYGGITAQRAANRLHEEQAHFDNLPPEEAELRLTEHVPRKSESGVIVEGVDSCLVKFARCCTPVPGDDIVGFVTRGNGVSIHCRDCTNMLAVDGDKSGRLVKVFWADEIDGQYLASVSIFARDRGNLLADITMLLANMHVPLHSVQTKQNGVGETEVTIGISVADTISLDSICVKLRKIGGINDIKRSGKAQ